MAGIKQMKFFKMIKYLKIIIPYCLFLTACDNSANYDNTSLNQVDTLKLKKVITEIIIKDSTILLYIQTEEGFIALSDEEKLPILVKSYYPGILEFLYENKMDKNNYYLDTTGIRVDSPTMVIPLYHYNGFIRAKEIEDKNNKAEEDRKNGKPAIFTAICGNLSGMDGCLEIVKRSKMVLGFGLWQ